FGLSNTAGVAVSATTEVNEIVFGSGASPFTISVNNPVTLTIDIGGVVNNSGATQNFLVEPGAILRLSGLGPLQDQVIYEVKGAADSSNVYGYMDLESANAGNATYILDGGTISGGIGSYFQFHDTTTGDNCSFIVNGGAAKFARGGFLE